MLTWLTFGIFLVGKFENEGEFANLWEMISRFDLKIGQKQSHFRLSNQFWPIALSPISISFCHRQAKKKKKKKMWKYLARFFFQPNNCKNNTNSKIGCANAKKPTVRKLEKYGYGGKSRKPDDILQYPHYMPPWRKLKYFADRRCLTNFIVRLYFTYPRTITFWQLAS